MDDVQEELYLASPGGFGSGSATAYHGFERSIDAQLGSSSAAALASGYSSSDMEATVMSPGHERNNNNHNHPYARARERTGTGNLSHRRMSTAEYSGVELGSVSDFSDFAGPTAGSAAARMSALSLADAQGRPSTSSIRPAGPQSQQPPQSSYSSSYSRPSIGARNASQMSGSGPNLEEAVTLTSSPTAVSPLTTQPLPPTTTATTQKKPSLDSSSERILYHGWIQLLKRSKSGVRSWKKIWMVLRPKHLALYKNDEEYSALLILPIENVVDVVEIDAISRTKQSCFQVITEEQKNFRFCASDEESLARWLGACKSLLGRRKVARQQAQAAQAQQQQQQQLGNLGQPQGQVVHSVPGVGQGHG
jgi:hypothetical protein